MRNRKEGGEDLESQAARVRHSFGRRNRAAQRVEKADDRVDANPRTPDEMEGQFFSCSCGSAAFSITWDRLRRTPVDVVWVAWLARIRSCGVDPLLEDAAGDIEEGSMRGLDHDDFDTNLVASDLD